MRKFEINDKLSVTDIGIDISGDCLEDLFIAGAEGMFEVLLENRSIGDTLEKTIELNSNSIDELLVDWLSELLYLFDTDELISTNIEMSISQKPAGFYLTGQVKFRKFNAEIDVAKNEIKAVTYYKLSIKREGDIYSTPVIFDL